MKECTYSLDDVYVSFNSSQYQNSTHHKAEELMKKSCIKEGFEQLKQLPNFNQKKGKKKKEEIDLPEEVLNDLEILKMRSVLDKKRFYKKNDIKKSKHIQVGKVLDSPVDFYSSRLPKKMRKKTLVDELLSDAEFQRDMKKRYQKIIEQNRKGNRKRWFKKNKQKNLPKGKK